MHGFVITNDFCNMFEEKRNAIVCTAEHCKKYFSFNTRSKSKFR